MIGDRKIKKEKGFTLIELMVAFGVLSIVITLAVGIFILSLRAQRIVLSEKKMSEI